METIYTTVTVVEQLKQYMLCKESRVSFAATAVNFLPVLLVNA